MTDHYEPSREDLREELEAEVQRAMDALYGARGTSLEAFAQGELARAENALAAFDGDDEAQRG